MLQVTDNTCSGKNILKYFVW